MPVEVTTALSPVMQEVADCRDLVRKCESDVEEKKTALKSAKVALEEAQRALNLAVDAAINAERQPTLFDPFGKGDEGDGSDDDGGGSGGGGSPPNSPAPTPALAGTGIALVVDATPVNASNVASLPAAEKLKTWRALNAAVELEIPDEVKTAFATHKVVTLCDLADALVAGKTLGLKLCDVEELKDWIEQVSANDAEPIEFDEVGGGNANAANDDADLDPTHEPRLANVGTFHPGREDFPDDKSGNWQFRIAVHEFNGNGDNREKRLLKHVASYRDRQAVGEAQSAWGKWSEFKVSLKLANGTEFVSQVLYKPDWNDGTGIGGSTSDHVELWGPVSPTGYWSEEITHAKGKRPKRPLAEWCREWAQSRLDQYQCEQAEASKAKGNGGKKQKKGAA